MYSGAMGQRKIKILFNSDISPSIPWNFMPQQRSVETIPGKPTLAFFSAENLSNQVVTGIAVYNVAPVKVGKYFNKVSCFCFSSQTLQPHAKIMMPVSFFIDPAIENDPEMDDIDTITLSYTFFKYRE